MANRRQFLIALCAPAIKKTAIKSDPPLKNRPLPEFWFGDSVTFCWNDEEDEQLYSETGEIIGCAWNPRENCWEYAVTWLSSTAYPNDHYPIFDGNFLTGDEICKL